MAWTTFNGVGVRADNIPEELAAWELSIFLNNRDQLFTIFSSPDSNECIEKTNGDLFCAYYRIGPGLAFRDVGKSETLSGAFELILRNRERKEEYAVADAYR